MQYTFENEVRVADELRSTQRMEQAHCNFVDSSVGEPHRAREHVEYFEEVVLVAHLYPGNVFLEV